MKNICVLGGSGFIGSNIIAKLRESKEFDVIGISRNRSDMCIGIDYSDSSSLAKIFSNSDVIINAVGSFKPRDFLDCQSEAFNQINNFTHNINKAIEESEFSGRFIHISSAGTIYGECKGKAFYEGDMPSPVTWYGRLKLLEEYQFSLMCENNNINFLCARLSNPFGNNKTKKHGFIDVLSKSFDENKSFSTCEDKRYKRDFIHVKDMVKVFERICLFENNEKRLIVNIGSGVSFSLREIAEFVNRKKEIVDFDYKPTPEDIAVVEINVKRMKDLLNIDWCFITPIEYFEEKFKRL